MKRIVIVGAPGSGKSTFARRLGAYLNIPVFERDGLGPLGSAEYRSAGASLISSEKWIFDGFPYYVDTDVYNAADAVIALDYSRRVVLHRVVKRSLSLRRGAQHGAHKPSGISEWFKHDHAVRVAWTKYGERKREIERLDHRSELGDSSILRFASPQDAEAWLRQRCTNA